MTKPVLKQKSRALRREGKSLSAISKKLGVSKSAVRVWCGDIVLSVRRKKELKAQSLEKNIARLRFFSKKRHEDAKIRIQKLHRLGVQDVGALSSREFFLAGLALYWGEGYKQGSGEVGFTNSDPTAIKFFIAWVQNTYGVAKKDLVGRLTINTTHRSRVRSIEKYWARVSGLPRAAFTKTSIIQSKSKRKFENPKTYYGTLRIKVRRSTDLQRRILGSLGRLAEKPVRGL